MTDQDWAPLLDPAWRRDFGPLDDGLVALLDTEHDCECSHCHVITAQRRHGVAVFWCMLGAERRERWWSAWGMEPRAAMLRDILADVDDLEALQAKIDDRRLR